MMIGADYENVQSQLAEPVRERNFFFEFMGSKRPLARLQSPVNSHVKLVSLFH